jgi:hypothetical protein
MSAVFLAILMGYGLVIWCGVPFTSLAQLGPFIFLGVGVDDVIVVLEAFRLARRSLPVGSTFTFPSAPIVIKLNVRRLESYHQSCAECSR